MFSSFLKRFNWVDLVIIILLLRTSYVASKKGFFAEVFKFLGMLLGVYLSLHYYTVLSDFLRSIIRVKEVPIEMLDFFSLIILAVLGYFVFFFLHMTLEKFIKVEAVNLIERWISFALGIGRAVLLASLIIYAFSIPVVTYLKRSVDNSLSSVYLYKVSPTVYKTIWDKVMSKFMPKEEFNKVVLESKRS